MKQKLVVVLVTCPPEAAARVASAVVEERLAACVNIVPGLHSVYRWQGEVKRDSEVLLVMKTARDRFEALKESVVRHHPYEVPEVIALPVDHGHAPYLEWVVEATR